MMNRFGYHLRSKRKKLGLSIKYLIKIADVYKENIHELLNILLSDHYNDHGAGI
jgi:hypothetical protein